MKDYKEYNDDTTVHFEVTLSEDNLIKAKQEGLEKKFKLTTTISTSNMHLFDHNGVIKKYETSEQILEEFFPLRSAYYEKRKKILLDNLKLDLLKVDNKVRFVLGVVEGDIIVSNRDETEVFLELVEKGFTPFPKKTKDIDVAIDGVAEEIEESKETPEAIKSASGVKPSDYDYLLDMRIRTLTKQKVQDLRVEKAKLENEMEELRRSTASFLWNKDLDALEKELDEFERQGVEAELMRKKIKEGAANGGIVVAKQAPKKPRKNIRKLSAATEPIAINSETVQEVTKAKQKGRQNKSTAKPVSVESDEDEELVALKDRLAAYNLDSSSPETSAMEAETVSEAVAAKEGSKKRAGAARKALKVVSDEDTGDEDFVSSKAPRGKKGGGGGRKTGNATKAKAATARMKRDAQDKPLLNHKLISELLPPATNAVDSPEKKVRKIRPSPFNKKSGSFINKPGINGTSSEDSSSRISDEAAQREDIAARERPKRENRTTVVYAESGSEDEDENEVSSEYSY